MQTIDVYSVAKLFSGILSSVILNFNIIPGMELLKNMFTYS